MKRLLMGAVSLMTAVSLLIPPAFAEGDKIPMDSNRLTGALTIDQVLAQVLLKNPALQAFSLEVRAREANALQAGLWPNPQLQIQSEDITGSGNFDSFRNAQTTVSINQWIRLGGKITKKERVANLSRDLAEWDYEAQRMNILTRTGQAFIEVLTLQEKMKLADNLVRLANDNLKAISNRVESGKVSPIEIVKAQVAMANTQLEKQNIASQLQSAKLRLATSWAEPDATFETVVGDLHTIKPLPSYSLLLGKLERNPGLSRWATEISHRQANLEFEESKSIPDIQLQGAFRRIEEIQENTLVVGVTIPLNIFDRNQGGIEEARHRKAKSNAEKSAVKLRLQSILADAYNRLSVAHKQATTIKNQILPGAQMAFNAVQEGYRFGKFGLLDVLDSQRTLFQSQSRHLEALGNYHKAVLDIERFTGEPLSSWGGVPDIAIKEEE